ncbi:MAG: protein phosphatase 2C domain-containing protein [Planctomycetes bacterium]|nr:protein phosphatase 2C domain-containing protein [Planctomycetota bacterium]
MRIRPAVHTDVGRVREHNEDNHLVAPELGLFIVADGMGGRAAGEVASHLAVQAVRDYVVAHRDRVDAFTAGESGAPASEIVRVLADSVLAAARSVFGASLAESDRRGMGTTLTALLIANDRAFVAHVGDSRAYLVRNGRATQITRDHSLVDELVLAGQLTREESKAPELERLRCVLARAVGVANDVAVDAMDLEAVPGDQFLLCSDGLSHYVQEDEIAALLLGDLHASVERFVQLACARGGHDNITALAVRCESAEPADMDRLRVSEQKSRALAAVPVLQALDPREFLQVVLASETIEATAGTIVMREDQPIPALFVVLEGRIRLARGGQPIDDAPAGTWFGEAALVDRWVAAPTAIAVEHTLLARLTRDALMAVARREPEIAPKIVAAFARDAAERVRPAAPR